MTQRNFGTLSRPLVSAFYPGTTSSIVISCLGCLGLGGSCANKNHRPSQAEVKLNNKKQTQGGFQVKVVLRLFIVEGRLKRQQLFTSVTPVTTLFKSRDMANKKVYQKLEFINTNNPHMLQIQFKHSQKHRLQIVPTSLEKC